MQLRRLRRRRRSSAASPTPPRTSSSSEAILTPAGTTSWSATRPTSPSRTRPSTQRYRELYTTCKGTYALTVPFMERFFELAKPGAATSRGLDRADHLELLHEARVRLQADRGLPRPTGPAAGRRHLGCLHPRPRHADGHPRRPAPAPGRARPSAPCSASGASPVGQRTRPRGWCGVPSSSTSISPATTTSGSQSPILSAQRLATHPWSLTGGGAVELLAAIDRHRHAQRLDRTQRHRVRRQSLGQMTHASCVRHPEPRPERLDGPTDVLVIGRTTVRDLDRCPRRTSSCPTTYDVRRRSTSDSPHSGCGRCRTSLGSTTRRSGEPERNAGLRMVRMHGSTCTASGSSDAAVDHLRVRGDAQPLRAGPRRARSSNSPRR